MGEFQTGREQIEYELHEMRTESGSDTELESKPDSEFELDFEAEPTAD